MFRRYLTISTFLICALLSAACAHQAVYMGTQAPSMAPLADDRHILAGEWEYIDSTGAVVPLTLDEQGNGHYEWKEGHLETHSLIDHTWSGMWFQEENDREGGFVVQFSQDFSEGEGEWWYSRIGTDKAPILNGGTFHLRSSSSSG